MRAGAGTEAQTGAAAWAGRAHAGLRLLFAVLILVTGVAAFVQAGNAASLKWHAAEVEGLVTAGVLCAHAHGPSVPSAPDRSPSHPCCPDGMACPCADGMLAPPPAPAALGAPCGFHMVGADLPAAQLAPLLPFKRGPPPRAPPRLVNASAAA